VQVLDRTDSGMGVEAALKRERADKWLKRREMERGWE
jgi:hypothetical protein